MIQIPSPCGESLHMTSQITARFQQALSLRVNKRSGKFRESFGLSEHHWLRESSGSGKHAIRRALFYGCRHESLISEFGPGFLTEHSDWIRKLWLCEYLVLECKFNQHNHWSRHTWLLVFRTRCGSDYEFAHRLRNAWVCLVKSACQYSGRIRNVLPFIVGTSKHSRRIGFFWIHFYKSTDKHH